MKDSIKTNETIVGLFEIGIGMYVNIEKEPNGQALWRDYEFMSTRD